ncbi:uncharacterized protein LOC112577255 [Pomacea canaliculata]|uniref:uncharacterized protein LOC112577255 n=1 Tax=Pomacea canaliculata TaxID=400727 RepID=UPI000D73BF9F|nr:uncharacterized protein LOC112577255 [Pomacea canaliculata]XP_025116088.1 uncharacterized protein LOC112577255 [Pomacea canaliculata]
MASLHLMAVSAIFTRCEKPDLELCSSFILSPKSNKKVASGWMKQTVFKFLKQFYDHFKDEVKELSSPPSWTDIVTASPEQDKSSRTSCFKLVMCAFSILNEMAKHGWTPLSLKLLNALKKMHEVTDLKTGKYRISQESKTMIDFFIIRSLVVLLQTVFVEDREPFGDSKYEHQKCISQIITGVIQSCSDNSSQKERLLREVRSLMFHKASSVRQTFRSLYRNVKMSLKDLASGHIEYSLRGLGFRLDEARDINSEGRQAITGTCSWNVSPCKLCDVKADCAMYLPTVNCMAQQDYHVGVCLDHHPSQHGKESATRSEMHKQNLTMLQRLSPMSDHMLKLLAYQYKPFPFYITEVVEEEDRLLSYLCLHRKEGRWLDTKTIAKIMSQIVDIVTLLENEGIVTRDLTCYNLVVRRNREEQEEKSRCQVLQSTDNYIIQLADLSLTHYYRNNGDICIVRDHGPIPVRWTAPEALFDGRYSLKSMVWQIGCVMYEIATYGCEPYTSYSMTTEDILKKMNKEPGSIKLFPWPCAPKVILDMVEKCTSWNPSERPSLESLKESLQHMEDADGAGEEMSLEESLIMETQYPSPSSRQTQRGHVPEKGIPPSVQQLIAARKDSPLYRKTRTESWHKESCTAIREESLSQTSG